MPRVYFKTYGCPMNERDSELVSQMFIERGCTMTLMGADEAVMLEVEMLCEGLSKMVATRLMGRMQTNRIGVFEGNAGRHVGQIFKVGVHGFENFTLYEDAILSD